MGAFRPSRPAIVPTVVCADLEGSLTMHCNRINSASATVWDLCRRTPSAGMVQDRLCPSCHGLAASQPGAWMAQKPFCLSKPANVIVLV